MNIKFKNKSLFKKEEINYIYETGFGKNINKSFKIKSTEITKNYKNEIIKLKYQYDNKENNISFFGLNFIKSNKKKCSIIFNNKGYNLINNTKEFRYIKKNEFIQIKLKIIENITDLSYMFFKCFSLISLQGISKLNTNNVNNMSCLFYGCSSLKYLPDLSKWNINKVIYIKGIFCLCCSLLSLPDISKWNIQNVINISGLFLGCSSLRILPDISKWNTKTLLI